ncbi:MULTISPECIES: hypothetical protein [unclassified Bradyrhizobium]|uniref:hypothetical protein n=1 Tax=unclassified Bradyrhizobium TaxID=2631580 RepID=UPI001CD66FEC|nr:MULTISPECIES: hypothetical protein [unclassified Bradyrhizobium]MCA1386458.1 hypothetical protein [Bradyrhizobium sp. BRP05]MCA1394564.1 hypothetical protein [Bradyrhizobium sp. IC3123]MCA1424192.1 hypothetical protein [Bradyrhizobium sp. BRP23]MCA1431252.1 hypothetical protein [Bradyrhizobium sp. NBAIM16]MCA1480670.1 hypothetical protein [Bradyrhizobium sp. NBAIM08]
MKKTNCSEAYAYLNWQEVLEWADRLSESQIYWKDEGPLSMRKPILLDAAQRVRGRKLSS